MESMTRTLRRFERAPRLSLTYSSSGSSESEGAYSDPDEARPAPVSVHCFLRIEDGIVCAVRGGVAKGFAIHTNAAWMSNGTRLTECLSCEW